MIAIGILMLVDSHDLVPGRCKQKIKRNKDLLLITNHAVGLLHFVHDPEGRASASPPHLLLHAILVTKGMMGRDQGHSPSLLATFIRGIIYLSPPLSFTVLGNSS
ncbi:hypothetical protein CEXT_658421 [Caerostris extrusa]|uniref:Uncharacterized protein n=1 Tax=Caerostris extrusa TaxID=172846 RepID=A0AAV4R245_CAEEX|nr:hypothetical protein CEXT_658421 [Caerostris extrusa]